MREVKTFEMDLAKQCQSGEVKGYVYCSNGIDAHKLVSEIKEIGTGYYAAWFKGLKDEYMQVFRYDGHIHNSKWRVYIETYTEPERKLRLWHSQKDRPLDKVPRKADGLTFAIISWLDEEFRDYALIYYAPCDERWWREGSDGDEDCLPDFDYWMLVPDVIEDAN